MNVYRTTAPNCYLKLNAVTANSCFAAAEVDFTGPDVLKCGQSRHFRKQKTTLPEYSYFEGSFVTQDSTFFPL
jgi:hypothetical protein